MRTLGGGAAADAARTAALRSEHMVNSIAQLLFPIRFRSDSHQLLPDESGSPKAGTYT